MGALLHSEERPSEEELIAAVAAKTGLERATLTAFRIPPSRNVFVSDRSLLFAKHTNACATHESAGISHALRANIFTPQLLQEPFLVGSSPVLCFAWHRLSGSVQDPRPLLEQFWATAAPAEAPLLTSSLRLDRVEANLSLTHHGAKEEALAILQELRHRISDLEAGKNATYLLHGDFHWRNTALVNGRPMVFDWEWWGAGHRELDVAKWLQAAFTTGAATPFSELVRWAELSALDLELLSAYVRLCGLGAFAYSSSMALPENLPRATDVARRGLAIFD